MEVTWVNFTTQKRREGSSLTGFFVRLVPQSLLANLPWVVSCYTSRSFIFTSLLTTEV